MMSSRLISFVLFICLFGLGIPRAEAAQGGRGAQVIFTQAQIPEKMKGSLSAFAKRNKAKRLNETKEPTLAERKWITKLIVSFSGPPGDSEMNLLFYDLDGGGRRYITSMSRFISGAHTQKEFLQTVTLSRPDFVPNHPIEVVVVMRQVEMGKARVLLTGETPRRSNKVEFSDEETRGP